MAPSSYCFLPVLHLLLFSVAAALPMQTVQLLELRFWACCGARRNRIETIVGDGKRALVSEDQPASHLWPLVVYMYIYMLIY